ncbi:Solute carrier family 22 member 5 [Taenia crassiceps]|uniref:Solute carrier family 22 member 5 n=1 Tax=Taenia crassiceps TaxID=6207 RepID=A0ABR4QJ62_9CEST
MHGTQIDQIFETLIGGLGAWQVCIILLISLSFSNNMIISVFFNSVPRHRCRADYSLETWFQSWNFTHVARFLGPVDESNNHFRQCRRYAGRAPANITVPALFEFYKSARGPARTANYTCFDGYVFEYSEVQYKESPRWLAACGRAEEAARILYSAYRFNSRFRKPQPGVLMTSEEFLQHVGLGPNGRQDVILRNMHLRAIYSSNEGAGEFALWQLFKPHLVKTTLLSTSILTCQITCIFGMMFFASNIKLHVSFVTIVNSIAQIPGCILAAALYRYCRSRKLPLLVIYLVVVFMGAVAAFHTMHFHPSTDTMLNVYSNVIILFLSAAQRMLFIYVPELYKPIYRNRGFGLSAGMARLGALWFPMINRLDKDVMHGLPLVVYTLIMVLQLVLILFLENTTGQARQSTITVLSVNGRVETDDSPQT